MFLLNNRIKLGVQSRLYFLAVVIATLHPSLVKAEEHKYSAYSVGTTTRFHVLNNAQNEPLLRGSSYGVHLGYGLIKETWFTNLALGVISGPFDTKQKEGLKIDFGGLAATFGGGYKISSTPIRDDRLSFGSSLYCDYETLSGKSSELPFFQNGSSSLSKYSLQVTSLNMTPSFFLSLVRPARLDGNTPALLLTRIEGIVMNIGVQLPIFSRYRISYLTSINNIDTLSTTSSELSGSGKARSYSVVASLFIFLGV